MLLAENSPLGPGLFRRLAKLTRSGVHLLLTASEPDQWFPTRGHIDDVLGAQGRLQHQLQEVGGDLDGIYYVPRSVFTQDRKRVDALRDILARYTSQPGDAMLVSSSKAFLKAAERLEIPVRPIPRGEDGMQTLVDVLETYPD